MGYRCACVCVIVETNISLISVRTPFKHARNNLVLIVLLELYRIVLLHFLFRLFSFKFHI